MPNDNPLGDRGRAIEDDYFRKRDRELIEKMRRASADEDMRRDLSSRTGLLDPEMLQELQALGFTPETAALLPLVPLVQMAWAEGGVSAAERKLIVQIARTRGIDEGGAADSQLAAWLSSAPDASVFTRAFRLIQAMLDAPGPGPERIDRCQRDKAGCQKDRAKHPEELHRNARDLNKGKVVDDGS